MTMDQAKRASCPAGETLFTSDEARVLSLLLNDTKTLVALKDLDHCCLFANHQLESLHAVQPGGLLGTQSDIFIAPETVTKIHAIENDIIHTGKPVHFVERVNING